MSETLKTLFFITLGINPLLCFTFILVKTAVGGDMFSKVDVKQKDSFLEQTKAQREERAYERQKEIATLKIQVCGETMHRGHKTVQLL